MKPDPSTNLNSPEYIRDLIVSIPKTREAICRDHLGIDVRTLRRYEHGQRKNIPYLIQFALECLVLDI